MSGIESGAVVVGVDDSPFSDVAVRWAVDFAVAHHAPLCILHAAGAPDGVSVPFDPDERRLPARAAQRVADRARNLALERAGDLKVTVLTPFEDARSALMAAHAARMVVVGTRGRGPIRALLLGSVSHAVVTHASGPVTVVRPVPEAGRRAPSHVVVGVTPQESSRAALEVGFDVAAVGGHSLRAVYAWSPHLGAVGPDRHRPPQALETPEQDLAAVLAGYAEKFPDVAVETRIVERPAAAALVKESETAAHVVLGGPHQNPTSRDQHDSRHVGSTGRLVVEHAHCPVTVVGPVQVAEAVAEAGGPEPRRPRG